MREGEERIEKKIDANAIVSPKNTERLYGKKLDQEDPPAAPETINTTLPEAFSGPDQEVEQNMFPSEPDRNSRQRNN